MQLQQPTFIPTGKCLLAFLTIIVVFFYDLGIELMSRFVRVLSKRVSVCSFVLKMDEKLTFVV